MLQLIKKIPTPKPLIKNSINQLNDSSQQNKLPPPKIPCPKIKLKEQPIPKLTDEQLLINIFLKNVKGCKAPTKKKSNKHDGDAGHRLEELMGIRHNSKNEPDILGYELKSDSGGDKFSYGDWSASQYLFSPDQTILEEHNNNVNYSMTKLKFMQIFGKFNHEKNRYSWSGAGAPIYYDKWTAHGTKLTIDLDNNVQIIYSNSHDHRTEQDEWCRGKENIVIAIWLREKLKRHVNDKYNVNGCVKITQKSGYYDQMYIAPAFNFEQFIAEFKAHKIIFESGMNADTCRLRSMWRGTAIHWNQRFTKVY